MESPASREREHGVVEAHLWVDDHPSVQIQEDERGVEARPLVTLDERLVLLDVERVRGSHVEQVWVKVDAIERRCGNGHG